MEEIGIYYIEDIERAKFFARFEFQNNIKTLFITNNLTVYLYLKIKNKNKKVQLLNITSNIKFISIPNLTNTIENKLSYCNKNESKKLYCSVYNTLDNLLKKYKIKFIFVWNGNKIGDLACKFFAKNHCISVLFFEISNIPGKIFIDECGTNKNSSLFLTPQKLDKLTYNEYEYENWKNNYIKIKKDNFILPQSKKKNKLLSLLSILIRYAGILLQISVKDFCVYRSIESLGLFNKKNVLIKGSTIDLKKFGRFVFVPLQVESDTQIIINSKINLMELIERAVDYAKSNNLKLIIKPHPAERNNKIFEYIKCLLNDNFVVANNNTFELIENAEVVITINSTVGLEALILEKTVIFLGETFYSKLSEERLKKYILKYLYNIEYFSNEKIVFDEEDNVNKYNSASL